MQKFITDLEQYIVNLEKYMKETVAEMLHQDMPVLLEEKFAIYEKTGSRMEYEWDYFARRKFLSIFGVAAIWMKREGMQKLGEVTFEEVVDKLEQVLLNICGEECWAVPAHVKRDVDPDWRNTIDLFGSETAQTLALITKEMGDSLSADCRSTVKENVSRRVVDNFFQSPVDTRWWEHGDNNWNAVCNGNVMSAYLHSLKDGETPREDYIARICDGLTRFIDGYSEDGTCLEGMAYFTYGMGYFSNVAFDLYDYTDGKIDLLQGDWYKFKAGQQDKRARICEWWPKCFFKGNKTVSFADGRDNDKYRLGFSCDLARIFPNVTFPSIEMAQNFAEDHNQRFMFLYKDLFSTKRYLQELKEHHEDVKQKEQSGSRFDILESAQWVIAESENGMGMACKGGHNMEPHNHNDIGSFMISKNGGVTFTDPVTRVEQGKDAADHDGGIHTGLHQNMGQHGGGGGFAVGAADADGVFVVPHDDTPGLGPLENGDAGLPGGGDLGVIVVGCGGADDAVGALDVLGAVADMDLNAVGQQLVGGNGGIHVRARDLDPHALQHQPQGAHGNAADAHQMDMLAGGDKCLDFLVATTHSQNLLKKGAVAPSHFMDLCRYIIV